MVGHIQSVLAITSYITYFKSEQMKTINNATVCQPVINFYELLQELSKRMGRVNTRLSAMM